jgi:hypothetical protein
MVLIFGSGCPMRSMMVTVGYPASGGGVAGA